jgi:hypothetical protein
LRANPTKFVNSNDAAICEKRRGIQLRQKLGGWSGHTASWLDQTDLPVYLIRYEDLCNNAAGAARRLSVCRACGDRGEDQSGRGIL